MKLVSVKALISVIGMLAVAGCAASASEALEAKETISEEFDAVRTARVTTITRSSWGNTVPVRTVQVSASTPGCR